MFGIHENAGLIILIISFVLGYGYHLLWTERVEMDLSNRTLIRKKRFGKIVLRKITKTLPLKCNFKYSVKKDFFSLYRRDRIVWLEAHSPQEKENIKLARFSDEKTFQDFHKIFNRTFPNNRIKTIPGDNTEFL